MPTSGDEERIALLREHRHGEHRYREQNAEAARYAAARIEDDTHRRGIDAGIDERHEPQGRPAQAPRDDEQHRGDEVRRAGSEKNLRMGQQDELAREQERAHQHQRHEQPIEIEEPDDAPGQVGLNGRSGR